VLKRLVVFGLVAGALLLGGAPAANAEVPITQVGWWTRSPTPPTVPEGGLSVAAAPDGDLTIGAVLLDAGEGGASGASLRLVEGSGGAGAEVAGIRVCPTSSTWSAEAGGALADAPEAQCDAASVDMVRGADGTWTADVQSLVEGKTGDVGLAVVPAEGSVAFQLNFAPPAVDGSVSESSGSDFTETTTATTMATSTSPSPAASSSPTPSFIAPVTPVPTVPAASNQVGAALPSDGSSATAAAVEFEPQLGGAVPAGESDSRVTKATVLLWYVLAMVIGAGVAGLTWLRNTGRLAPADLLARVRR
jgi:hypothetical protein